MTEEQKKKARIEKVVSIISNTLVELAVVGALAYAVITGAISIGDDGIKLIVAAIGGWWAKIGAEKAGAGGNKAMLVGIGQALAHGIRAMKGLALPIALAASVGATGCAGLGQAAKDVSDHVVFRGTLGGLVGACQATRGESDVWDAVCDGVNQLDALTGLLQSGAGPATLPADVASRECLALEDGTVECER